MPETFKPLTSLADVELRIIEINAHVDDPEIAHMLEDALMVSFITYVSLCSNEPVIRDMATRILNDVDDFDYWYA